MVKNGELNLYMVVLIAYYHDGEEGSLPAISSISIFKLSRQLCEPQFPCEFGGNSSPQGQATSLSSKTMNLKCHCCPWLPGNRLCPLAGLSLLPALQRQPYLTDAFQLPETREAEYFTLHIVDDDETHTETVLQKLQAVSLPQAKGTQIEWTCNSVAITQPTQIEWT